MTTIFMKTNATFAMKASLYTTNNTVNPILNRHVLIIFQWLFFTVICQLIDTFGVVANIINIMCFIKQGFKEPANVSMMGLAVSDLGSLVTLMWTNVCFTPAFLEADLPFDALEVNYLTSGIPHATFTRITSWITAIITLERCLCISAPLKVRSIMDSSRVTIIICAIFLISIITNVPVYAVNRLDLKYFPAKNTTLVGLVFTENRLIVETIAFTINNVIVPLSAFVVIITCTVILAVKLHKKTYWRQISLTTAQADSVSSRHHKLTKMIIIISTLFIVCFVPLSIIFMAITLEPGLSVDGKYINILTIMGMMIIFMESLNSSANIFVYYHMSSKFRAVFNELFRFHTNTKT